MAYTNSINSFGSLKPINNVTTPSVEPEKENKTIIKDEVNISAGESASPKKVKLRIYPQDPMVGKKGDTVETEIVEIEQSKTGNDLQGEKIICKDSCNPIVIADPDGNFFYSPSDPGITQVTSFATVQRTFDMFDNFIGRTCDLAFAGPINVNADAGNLPNAFYNRKGARINLYHFKSNYLNKTVKAGDSPDIVSHEATHAKLDGVRPLFITGWGAENASYCEAIADAGAMLNNLFSETNLNEIIKETGGDLRKSNRLAMVAEEFGTGVWHEDTNPNNDNQTYLRNLINDFKYKPMKELPEQSENLEELTSEIHNFSRILSGAFYDCLEASFHKNLGKDAKSASQEEMVNALKKSRDTMGPIIFKSVELTSLANIDFKEAAQTLLEADEIINKGENKELLTKVFEKRNLLESEDSKPEVMFFMAPQESLPSVKMDKPPASSEEALEFLQNNQSGLDIEANKYNSAKITTDKYGSTILEYMSTTEVPVTDDKQSQVKNGKDDLYMDIYSGLTLAFNKDGKLISCREDKTDVPEIIKNVKAAISKGLITEQTAPDSPGDSLFKLTRSNPLGEIYKDENGKTKIQRLPVIVG